MRFLLHRFLLHKGLLAALLILVAPVATLRAQFYQSRYPAPGAQQIEAHLPWSPNYVPLSPNVLPRYVGGNTGGGGFGHGHHHRHGAYWYGAYSPWIGGYYPGYYPGYYLNFGTAYDFGPYVLPPVFLSADAFYGLQPLGGAVNQPQQAAAPPGNAAAPANANAAAAARIDPRDAKPAPRVSNPETKARAGRALAAGDANFGKQNYLGALERYRAAATTAPDLAEAYLRQGFALVAINRYESAAKAFRRGLRVQPRWHNAALRLDDLYGQAQNTKLLHIESLAHALADDPLNADLLFVLGMEVYFDEQAERALPFFAKAAQLGGNSDRSLDGFLHPPLKAEKPAEAPAAQQREF